MRVGRNSKTDAFTNVNVYNVSTAYNLDTSCPRCISHKHLIVSELTGKELYVKPSSHTFYLREVSTIYNWI